MKIIWFSWKDIKNPLAGGAEIITDGILTRLAARGDEVILLTAGYKGAKATDKIHGYKVIRVGGRWSVYLAAYSYYKKNLKDWADLTFEEINTIPFFTPFYVKEKHYLFFHQLCRQIWFYQLFFPLSLIGYLLEPVYLRLLSRQKVITISDSTKNDLLHYGFRKKNIQIISEAIEITPIKTLEEAKKYHTFTILSLGAIRPMKRTLHQIKAFELAKQEIPSLKLKLAGAGEGKYFQKVMKYIESSPYKKDIEVLGRVSFEDKIKLMQQCHLILVTSIKEGWGLIVTEANSQGTPAAVYNVDGLRDSVKNGKTGWVAEKNNPTALAQKILEAYRNKSAYDKMRQNGWNWSQKINFDSTFNDFVKIIL